MQGAGSPFEPWATTLAEGVLLHGRKHLLRDALGNVGAEPVFPARFVLAIPGKGDDGRRREPSFFRKMAEFEATLLFVGDGTGVLPGFRLLHQTMTAQRLAQRGVVQTPARLHSPGHYPVFAGLYDQGNSENEGGRGGAFHLCFCCSMYCLTTSTHHSTERCAMKPCSAGELKR